MRFVALEDRVADAKTIWLNREQLTRAGAVAPLRLDRCRPARRRLSRHGRPDATVIQGRRPRLPRSGGNDQGRRVSRRRSGHKWTPPQARVAEASPTNGPRASP